MRVILTGGAGFIGSHMVDTLLENGCEVTILDNLSTGRLENLKHVSGAVDIIECDLSKEGEWQKHFNKCNWVIHLAALADIVPSIRDPKGYFNSNVRGTLNVLQASVSAGVERFVYAASSSCYGIPDTFPTPEYAPNRPQYPYALTKVMGEDLVMHWSQIYGLPALSLRFFNVYGTRSRTSGTYGAVFGVFLAQKLAKSALTVVGDGNQTRDFTYVTDITRAILAAARSDKSGHIYNVGSGQTVSINRIVELIGGDSIFIPRRPGEPDCTFADTTKIRRELDWVPEIPIEKGVKMVLENIDYWRDAPVWNAKTIEKATSDWFKFLGQEKTL